MVVLSNEFIEPELENWVAESYKRRSVMNSPVLLFMVFGISIGLTTLIFPQAKHYFQDIKDCGDITNRPSLSPEKKIPLIHNQYCEMTGIISGLRVFSAGSEKIDSLKPDDDRFPTQTEFEGVHYFAKLAGDKVFVVLDAAADDVYRHRSENRRDGLFGFNINHAGRVVDPKTEGGKYSKIGAFLRKQFALSASDDMRLLDTTDIPQNHLTHFIALCVAFVGVLLSGFGLLRLWRRRMEQANSP